MNNGWVKMYRKILNKGWYKKSHYVHLWNHLLLKANHQDNEFWFNGKNMIVKKGQFITGRKKLNMETGINESKIERILKFFEKNEHQIEQQKTNKNRLITILNWNEYQSIEQQIEQQVNNKRTTTEQQVNTNKKEKKEENVKNEKNINIYDKFCNEILDKYSLKVKNKKDLKKYFSLFGGYEGFFKMVDRYFIYYNAFKLHGWDLQYRYGNGWHNFIDHMADFKTDEDLRDKLESKGKRKVKKKISGFGVGSDELLKKGREKTEALLKKIEEEKKNESIM